MHGHMPIITDTCKYHVSNMDARPLYYILYYAYIYDPQNLTCLPCMAHASLDLVPGLAISLGTRL